MLCLVVVATSLLTAARSDDGLVLPLSAQEPEMQTIVAHMGDFATKPESSGNTMELLNPTRRLSPSSASR